MKKGIILILFIFITASIFAQDVFIYKKYKFGMSKKECLSINNELNDYQFYSSTIPFGSSIFGYRNPSLEMDYIPNPFDIDTKDFSELWSNEENLIFYKDSLIAVTISFNFYDYVLNELENKYGKIELKYFSDKNGLLETCTWENGNRLIVYEKQFSQDIHYVDLNSYLNFEKQCLQTILKKKEKTYSLLD